jgi:selenide,water dikinase
MGGRPIVAVNLVGWPRATLPTELLREVLRGGLDVASTAGCPVAGGHSIDDPEPKYGMAVTGVADPDRLLLNSRARAGLPLSLTKPLGVGVLNNRHKATGEVFPQAVESMVALNDTASRAALTAGVEAATDVTGFGLLGHLFKMMRASGVSAVVDAASVPYLEGARASLKAGYVSGGTRRNLDWVRPHLVADGVDEDELLLLADAQTSGGLLVVGEIPGAPVVGEVVPRRSAAVTVR